MVKTMTELNPRMFRNLYILIGTVVLMLFGWQEAMVLNGVVLGACLFALTVNKGKKTDE